MVKVKRETAILRYGHGWFLCIVCAAADGGATLHAMEEQGAEKPEVKRITAIHQSETAQSSEKSQDHSSSVVVVVADQTPLRQDCVELSSSLRPPTTRGRRNSVTVQIDTGSSAKDGKNGKHDSVIFEIEIPDEVLEADPVDIDIIIDDLVREAGIAAFGRHVEGAFYAEELHRILHNTFATLIEEKHAKLAKSCSDFRQATDPGAGSADGASERVVHISSAREYVRGRCARPKDRQLAMKKDAADAVRAALLKRVTSSHDLRAEASETGGQRNESDALRQWVLLELESRDKAMQEEHAKTTEKLEDERRRKRYAMMSTLATALGGITATLVAYYNQHTGHSNSC